MTLSLESLATVIVALPRFFLHLGAVLPNTFGVVELGKNGILPQGTGVGKTKLEPELRTRRFAFRRLEGRWSCGFWWIGFWEEMGCVMSRASRPLEGLLKRFVFLGGGSVFFGGGSSGYCKNHGSF